MVNLFTHSRLIVTTILLFVILASTCFARDYIIYSIAHDLPLSGVISDNIRRNYYINMGTSQGLGPGTKLDVFRRISRSNPFDSNKRYSYKIKVGSLEVIHAEEQSSIATALNFINDESTPILEVNGYMIGDQVEVHVSQ